MQEAVSPPFVMMFWVIEFYVFWIFQVHQEHFLVNKCEVLPLFEMFYQLGSGMVKGWPMSFFIIISWGPFTPIFLISTTHTSFKTSFKYVPVLNMYHFQILVVGKNSFTGENNLLMCSKSGSSFWIPQTHLTSTNGKTGLRVSKVSLNEVAGASINSFSLDLDTHA